MAGEWKYKSDAILRGAVLCTFAIGAVASLVAFAWHQGGTGTFYAMLMVGFGMAFPLTLHFQLLMRWAGSSPPTDEAVAARVAYDANRSDLIRSGAYAGALSAIIAFVT